MNLPPDRDEKGRFVKGRVPTRNNLWGWILTNSEILKIIFAVAAGIFALIEYRSKEYVDHVKNSADVIEAFYKSDEFKALIELQEFYLSTDLAQKRRDIEQSKITSDEYREYVRKKVAQSYRSDLIRAIRGLKTVSICVVQGRCEYVSACMHLARTMEDLRCIFRESIVDLSEDDGVCVVDEINYFLDHYCTDWVSTYLGVPTYSSIKDNFCLYDKDRKRSKIGDSCINSIIYKRKRNFFETLLD